MNLSVRVTAPDRSATFRGPAWPTVNRWEQRLRADVWSVAALHATPEQLLAVGTEHPLTHYRNPDPARFLADPFPFGDHGIACEEFSYSAARGLLVAFDEHDGELSNRRVIEDDGRHLSYPFLFEHEGELWCIPERAAAGGIHLYRFDGTKLHHERCLVPDVPAFDTSVIWIDGRWWAFFSHRDGTAMGNRLDLWFAETLTGTWRPHPSSPFSGSGPTLRPGGTPLLIGGAWYRPSQDCRHTYGGHLVLQRIDELSSTAYHETPFVGLEVAGDSSFAGPHTLSVAGDRVLVDIKQRRIRPDALVGRVRRRVRTGRRPSTGNPNRASS